MNTITNNIQLNNSIENRIKDEENKIYTNNNPWINQGVTLLEDSQYRRIYTIQIMPKKDYLKNNPILKLSQTMKEHLKQEGYDGYLYDFKTPGQIIATYYVKLETAIQRLKQKIQN